MSLINYIIENPVTPVEARQAALGRIHRSPGLPTAKGSTEPFWLRDPHPTISKLQSENLPKDADIAIIGSGITGLSVAWKVLHTAKEEGVNPPSIVMLEARDACSGATGRNGGHLLETALEYLEFKQAVGQEAAMKLTRFRLGHLPEMEELVRTRPEIRKDSQLRTVEFISVYFDEESFKAAVQSLAEFKKDMPEESSAFASHAGEKLIKELGLSSYAVGAITGPAGAVWPYRLVTHLLAELQRTFAPSFRLETNTPVTGIEAAVLQTPLDQPHPYRITTPRGVLRATHVVHCTNGHAGHLVPGLRGRIVPVRGQMSAQGAGARFANQASAHSWLINYHHGFDYLTQLPAAEDGTGSEGEMMLGGGLAAAWHGGLEEVGVASDDAVDLYVDVHLSGALPVVFGRERWGQSEGVKSMWTGIMGFSADGFPWVGELTESLTGRRRGEAAGGAEWAAVGYSGEGMVHAWLSGKAVAILLLERQGIIPASAVEGMYSWLPEQLRITEERTERAVISGVVASS